MQRWLERGWYRGGSAGTVLRPLSALFHGLVCLRRALYRVGVLRSAHPGRPVIVVGNLTVGGSGKTPFTIWLARELAGAGLRVGIVSRGYRGRATGVTRVDAHSSSAAEVGDEAILLARHSGAQVVVSRDRLAGARSLAPAVDVIVSDDGLQHYRLQRNFEIAIVDGQRGFGNARLLPAGPLREPVSRLDQVDAVVVNGGDTTSSQYAMRLVASAVVGLNSGLREPPAAWQGRRVHAVAGIGHPERFFRQLRELGIAPIEHPFADHATFTLGDVSFDDGLPVVMTEKDAVKCEGFRALPLSYLQVEASLTAVDAGRLINAVVNVVRGA